MATDPKPAHLPGIGEVVADVVKTQNVAGPGSGRVTGTTTTVYWKRHITWDGYDDEPRLRATPYRYRQTVLKSTNGGKTYTLVSNSSYPWGTQQSPFHSNLAPQRYGWKPSTGGSNAGEQKPKTGTGTPGSGLGGSGTTTGPTVTVTSLKGKGLTFNPPLHKFTRGLVTPYEKGNTPARGFFYLPTTFFKNTDKGLSAYTKRWAFQFQYNPTYWGYTMSADESMTTPEQVGSSIAPFLTPGTTSWSFSLYLNRIIDLTAGMGKAKYYSRLNSGDLSGIQARGTEYDLDYLYRIINGDPRKIKAAMSFRSANIGFLTKQRVGVVLGKATAFYGTIDNITVQHLMMNEKMIPSFTEVTVTMSEFIQGTAK